MNLFYSLCSILLLCSCSSTKNEKEKQDQKLIIVESMSNKVKELEVKGSQSAELVDTVFLGLKFGMTEDQVRDYLVRLKTEGKIIADSNGHVYCEIDSKQGKYKGYLYADYLENRLLKIGMTFKDEIHPMPVFTALSDLYAGKYGVPNITWKLMDDAEVYYKFWFKNNLKIKVETLMDASVEYVDLRFEEKKRILDSIQNFGKK